MNFKYALVSTAIAAALSGAEASAATVVYGFGFEYYSSGSIGFPYYGYPPVPWSAELTFDTASNRLLDFAIQTSEYTNFPGFTNYSALYSLLEANPSCDIQCVVGSLDGATWYMNTQGINLDLVGDLSGRVPIRFSLPIPSFQTSGKVYSVGPVPEPSTWAMLLSGFGAIGYAMRGWRRKRAVGFA